MTVYVAGIRIGQNNSSAMFNDSKLSTLLTDLADTLGTSSEANVVADSISFLEAEHGSGNVSNATSVKYKRVWNPDTEGWDKVQATATNIDVDDGESTECRVTITLSTIVT